MKKKPKLAGKGEFRSAHNYLVTSGKQCNRGTHAASLDVLNTNSAVATTAGDGMRSLKNPKPRFSLGAASNYKAPQPDLGTAERLGNFEGLDTDKETVAVSVLAGIRGSPSSQAMSSCNLSSFDPVEGYQDSKCQKFVSSIRRPLTPEVAESIDDETCSDESSEEMYHADWTDDEKSVFVQAVTAYGTDFAIISQRVRTKSKNQCRVFFSKARNSPALNMIGQRSVDDKVLAGNGDDYGGSESDYASGLLNGSVICSEKSESKLDDGLALGRKVDMEMKYSSKVEQDAISQSNMEELLKAGPELDEDMVDLNLKTCESYPADSKSLLSVMNPSVEGSRTQTIEGSPEFVPDADPLSEEGKEQNSVGNCKMGSVGSWSLLVPSLNIEEGGVTGSGFSLEQPVICERSSDHKLSVSGAEGEYEAGEVSIDCSITDQEGKLLSSVNGSGYEDVDQGGNFCGSQQIDISDNDLDASGGASNVAIDVNLLVKDPEKEQKTTFELNPSPMSLFRSFDQNVSPSSNIGFVFKQGAHSVSAFGERSYGQQSINSAAAYDCNKHRPGLAVSGPAESCTVLAAHPIPKATGNNMYGDVFSKKQALLQTHSTMGCDANSGKKLLKPCGLRKCSSESHSSASGFPFLPIDNRYNHGHTDSSYSSDLVKPYKNSDVKLFGKVLTSTSTQQNHSIGGVCKNNQKASQLPDLSSSSLNMKSGACSVCLNPVPPKIEGDNYMGLEKASDRNYGFLEGKRIQTGVSSLPESKSNGEYLSRNAVSEYPMYKYWENGDNSVEP